MHNSVMLGCKPSKPHKPSQQPKNICDYQFVLLNGERSIGCIKGYKNNNDVVLYVCGMKNTFHISPYISRCEMRDFLELMCCEIFTKTYFGAKIQIPGLDGVRQLFGIAENMINGDCVISSWKEEIGTFEREEESDLDIYPDKYEEDNTKSEVNNDDQSNERVDDSSNEDNSVKDNDLTSDGTTENPDNENTMVEEDTYIPNVNIRLDDDEYGLLLDITVTGFIDAHNPHHHHHKPIKEFDEDPTDDMELDSDMDDGIDHVNKALYL